MPIRVVGRASKYDGKTLYDIALNLKNFGAGRIVYRNAFKRYSEPTFYKIVSVEPDLESDRLGKVIVEQTFRGKYYGQRLLGAAYKPDFRLLPKEDEDSFCNRQIAPAPEKLLPKFRPFPPLLKRMILDEMKAKGQPCDKEPQLKMVYRSANFAQYRVANEGEVPNVEFTPHTSWNLYEDVMEVPKKST